MNYGFGQTPLNEEKTKVLMVRRALLTLNLSLDLNLILSVERILRVLLAYIYIFFFQEINDSLKNLLFYPVHFNLLIDDLIKIEFYLRVNLNSSLSKYCRQFLHTYKDSQTDACW